MSSFTNGTQDLLDRINTAAHERIIATAQYHCQHRLWRSALLAAGMRMPMAAPFFRLGRFVAPDRGIVIQKRLCVYTPHSNVFMDPVLGLLK